MFQIRTTERPQINSLFQMVAMPPQDRSIVLLRQGKSLAVTFRDLDERHGIAVYHPANRSEAEQVLFGAQRAYELQGPEAARAKLTELAQLLDYDLALQNQAVADTCNLPLEYAGRFPVTAQTLTLHYSDGSVWDLIPAHVAQVEIPYEAQRILLNEARAGLRFDEFWVAEERHVGARPASLPSRRNLWGLGPALAVAIAEGAAIAGSAARELAAKLPRLDPAVCGVVRGGEWSGYMFILVRWS